MGFNYKWYKSRLKIPTVDRLPSGQWLTVEQAAKRLGVSQQTVRIWYLKKEIEALKFDGHIIVSI